MIHLQFTRSVRTGGVDFTSTPRPNMLPWHISPRSRAKHTPTHKAAIVSRAASCFHSSSVVVVWWSYLQDGGSSHTSFLSFSSVTLSEMTYAAENHLSFRLQAVNTLQEEAGQRSKVVQHNGLVSCWRTLGLVFLFIFYQCMLIIPW